MYFYQQPPPLEATANYGIKPSLNGYRWAQKVG